MKKYLFFFIFAFSALLAKEKVQVIAVKSSPQPENARIYISYPKKGEIERSSTVIMQLKLRGFPLGNISQVPRADELANSKMGQSIHVVIDNEPYFARTGPSLAPYDEEGNFYEAQYRFKIPYHLSKGEHFIRVFPCRSFGESLKSQGSFAASSFFVETKKENQNVNLSQPYLTYNEPSGYLKLTERQPVLLDFYLSNAELSKDGYKIRLTIDKNIKRILTAWTPYYIYGLRNGKHTIRLELINRNGDKVPGEFNDIQRTFKISK